MIDERFWLRKYIRDYSSSDCLFAGFVRSSLPHAKILGVRVPESVSRRAKIVVTGKDVFGRLSNVGPSPTLRLDRVWEVPVLPHRKALFVGQPLAMVVADDPYLCADLAEEVEVEYEALPAVTTVSEASAGRVLVLEELGSNLAGQVSVSRGEQPKEGTQTVEVEIGVERQVAAPIETRGVYAYIQGGRLVVVVPTKMPYETKRVIASVLRLEANSVRVITPIIGGSFGSKGPIYPEELLVCYAALKLGRPVFWAATRTEEMLGSNHARDSVFKAKGEFTRDGRLVGLEVEGSIDCGAPWVSNLGSLIRGSPLLTGCYRIPHVRVDVRAYFTNKTPSGPVRGNGRPEAILVVERLMDEGARLLGFDPLELRKVNVLDIKDQPYDNGLGARFLDCDFRGLLEEFKERSGYSGWRAKKLRAGGSRLIGVGLSLYVEDTGGRGVEGASIKMHPDGRIVVGVGAVFYGQNIGGLVRKIVSSRLGVPPEKVDVEFADTDVVREGGGSFGSRSSVMVGGAVSLALDNMIERLKRFVGRELGGTPESVTLSDGSVICGGFKAGLFDVARMYLERLGEPLGGEAVYKGETTTYSYGAHLAVVEVEPDTGGVRVLHYYGIDDVGTVYDEGEVHGQMLGGIFYAYSNAALERFVYDDDGMPLTTNFYGYGVAGVESSFDAILELRSTPARTNRLGARGVGEGGTVGGLAAIVNAIQDAVRQRGVVVTRVPWRPETLLK